MGDNLSFQFSALQLVALMFKRTNVAAGCVFLVGTGHATLIGRQEMTRAVFTTTGITRINRRASREQSLCLGRATIVLERSEHGVGVVHVARTVEIAGTIAAHV